VLQRHAQRRDVARACVRSVINLSRYASVLSALGSAGVVDPMLLAVSLHPHARDITESATAAIHSAHLTVARSC